MTDTNFRARLKVEIRSAMCKLANQLVMDEIVHPDDVAFNLSNPGDDTDFHQIVSYIADMTIEHMYEEIEEAITVGLPND